MRQKLIFVLLFAAIACRREAVAPRMLVHTADMHILVDDTRRAVDDVTESVESAGGYVSDANVWREGDLLRARLVLRVPPAQLTETLASLRTLATRVESERVTAQERRPPAGRTADR